ncbi:MAG TPA: DUF58 domain-containing protein [Polyangiales bacterium]|nr:DUF58 domain-containing protein [Polyangiales bacterium]
MNRARFIPGSRLVLLFLPTLPLFVLGQSGALAGFACDLALLLLAWFDARRLHRQLPSVERVIDTRVLLGVPQRVLLKLHNPTGTRIRGTLRDDTPAELRVDRTDLAFDLPPHARRQLAYEVRSERRGQFAFGDVHLRLEGRAGLGARLCTIPAAAEVRVYPNLRGPRRYELAARLGALHSVGVHNRRKHGGSGQFEELREYVPGDPFRDLDWKASAKRRRPITRLHGQEQSQTVLLALDAGRLMATRLDDLTKLDHAIHAALLLAWVALRASDRVGLLVFADQVLGYVPPGHGRGQYGRILDALFAVEARPTYVDFKRLAQFVRTRVPRRALFVLFSDLLDDSQALPLVAAAPQLRGKHLPLCVTLTDPAAAALARAHVASAADAYRRAAAADLLAERAAVKLRLSKAGIGLVEAPASELAVATVNRYLELKLRHAV